MSYKRMMRSVGVGLFGLLWCVIAQATTTLSIGSGSVDQSGTYVSLPVTLTSDVPVSGLQFDVSFDATYLSVGTPSSGVALGTHVLSYATLAPGQLRIVVTPPSTSNEVPIGSRGQSA